MNVKGAQTRLVGPFRTMSDNGSVDRVMMLLERFVTENMGLLMKRLDFYSAAARTKRFRQEVPDNDADNIAWLDSWDKGEQSVDI